MNTLIFSYFAQFSKQLAFAVIAAVRGITGKGRVVEHINLDHNVAHPQKLRQLTSAVMLSLRENGRYRCGRQHVVPQHFAGGLKKKGAVNAS
jgi:hypothetical protein